MGRASPSLLDVCQARLHALEAAVDLRAIATAPELCTALAAQRQQPIYLLSHPFAPPLTGALFVTPAAAYIFYAADISLALQQHTILHEVAHLLSLPPDATQVDVDALHRDLLSHLDPATIQAAFQRSGYHTAREQEAELLASLIEQRWRAAHPPHGNRSAGKPSEPDIRWLQELLNPPT